MLLRMNHESEGAVATNVVSLSNHIVSNSRPNGICFAGVKFDADGILYLINQDLSYSAVVGEWLVNGTNSTFYLSRTVNSGTLTADGGTIQQLNGDQEYYVSQSILGSNPASVTFSIYDNNGETPGGIFPVTATITMTATIGSGGGP